MQINRGFMPAPVSASQNCPQASCFLRFRPLVTKFWTR